MKTLKAIIPEMTMFPATTAIPIPCHLWMPPLALVHPNSLESLKLEQQKTGGPPKDCLFDFDFL